MVKSTGSTAGCSSTFRDNLGDVYKHISETRFQVVRLGIVCINAD